MALFATFFWTSKEQLCITPYLNKPQQKHQNISAYVIKKNFIYFFKYFLSYFRHGYFCPSSIHLSFFTLRPPPLGFWNWWTGELCWKTNPLNLQNLKNSIFFGKKIIKKNWKKWFFDIFSKFKIFFYYFWQFVGFLWIFLGLFRFLLDVFHIFFGFVYFWICLDFLIFWNFFNFFWIFLVFSDTFQSY